MSCSIRRIVLGVYYRHTGLACSQDVHTRAAYNQPQGNGMLSTSTQLRMTAHSNDVTAAGKTAVSPQVTAHMRRVVFRQDEKHGRCQHRWGRSYH